MPDWLIAIAEARAALAASGDRYLQPLTRGTMRCVLYAPKKIDEQTPHTQDELYVITAGSGAFERDGERTDFAPGDAIFVPAGMHHRFVDFSDDFECWAIFWGPKGGEG
jgi:mannose-6-phosphate isomerase-like protein (cupin superfamily)